MILTEYGVGSGAQSVSLPNDLMWVDEHDWTPPAGLATYALDGSFIVEVVARLGGRPITLEATDKSMAWITRAVLEQLYLWSQTPEKLFTLQFTYPTDTRSFVVGFRVQDTSPIKAVPVKGFPGPDVSDYFNVTLNLQEMPQ